MRKGCRKNWNTAKPVLSGHSKIDKIKIINDNWYLNEGRKYCKMLPLEHSVILLTCIKRIFGLFEWLLKTGFTVYHICLKLFFQMLQFTKKKVLKGRGKI